jgi:hypothetical protein
VDKQLRRHPRRHVRLHRRDFADLRRLLPGPRLHGPAPSTGTILPTPAGDGILELNGYAYIAGDPFEMNISVPEPTSLALIPAAGLLLLLRRQRLWMSITGSSSGNASKTSRSL